MGYLADLINSLNTRVEEPNLSEGSRESIVRQLAFTPAAVSVNFFVFLGN